MQMNAVTLVSDCLLFLAEQQAIMNDKISTNNMVVILTLDRIIKVLEVNVPNDSNGYRDRVIYLSCNNCLTFHVFKTSLNDITFHA